MLLDAQNLFSENQTITSGTIISDNVVKFGEGDVSYVPIVIQVTNDFTDLTELKVVVETSKDAEFSSSVVLLETTLPQQSLIAGAKFPLAYLPRGNKGYMRLSYVVVGSAETKGKITAGVVASNDLSWQEM